MTHILTLATLWFSLALLAALIAGRLKVASSLMELIIGIFASFLVLKLFNLDSFGSDEQFIEFLAVLGTILITFLAGAELNPKVVKIKLKEACILGIGGFLLPFLACSSVTYFYLNWSYKASLLAGIALSAGGVPVVYAAMLETGLGSTTYGKKILAACFINDLFTVISLALLFSSFDIKVAICVIVIIAFLIALPSITHVIFRKYHERPSEMEAKFIIFCLLLLSACASWAGIESVIPAYFVGAALAKIAGQNTKNKTVIRRIRTVTFGLLTPFAFIRIGSYVEFDSLLYIPSILMILLFSKIAAKFIGIYFVAKVYKAPHSEAMYTTLLITTGLTFGCIATLFGYSKGTINVSQYSFLIATVIVSTIIPLIIANRSYIPIKHLRRLKIKL